jgi:hydroxypyruvate isomerase
MIEGLSAHLNMLYAEDTLAEGCRRAAADGFRCVETWAVPAGEDAVAFQREVERHGLALASVNTSAGPLSEDFGRLGDPFVVKWWRDDFLQTLRFARDAGAGAINILAGGRAKGAPRLEQLRCLRDNLDWALSQRREGDPILLIEPLNGADRKSPLVQRVEDALSVFSQLGDPDGLRLLFDAYHVFQEEDGLTAALHAAKGLIGHVQVADFPGRGAPGTGQIPFGEFVQQLASAKYSGWIGLEYLPGNDSCRSGGELHALRSLGLTTAAAS